MQTIVTPDFEKLFDYYIKTDTGRCDRTKLNWCKQTNNRFAESQGVDIASDEGSCKI